VEILHYKLLLSVPHFLSLIPKLALMASWNARQLLDVYPQEPYFTCVGTTLKGLRCRQSFLKNVHKAEADRLLDLLPPPEHFRSNPSELLPTLRHHLFLNSLHNHIHIRWLSSALDVPDLSTTDSSSTSTNFIRSSTALKYILYLSLPYRGTYFGSFQ
jgi:hypothetical protein